MTKEADEHECVSVLRERVRKLRVYIYNNDSAIVPASDGTNDYCQIYGFETSPLDSTMTDSCLFCLLIIFFFPFLALGRVFHQCKIFEKQLTSFLVCQFSSNPTRPLYNIFFCNYLSSSSSPNIFHFLLPIICGVPPSFSGDHSSDDTVQCK